MCLFEMCITKVTRDYRYPFICLNNKNTFRIDRFCNISKCSCQLMRKFIIFISLFICTFADEGDCIKAKIKSKTAPEHNNLCELKKDIRIMPIEIKLLRIIRVIIPIPVFPFSPMRNLSGHLRKSNIHIPLFTINYVSSPYSAFFMKLSNEARLFLLYDEIPSVFFISSLSFLKPLVFF